MFIEVLVDVTVNCTPVILITVKTEHVLVCFIFQGGATAGHVACLSSMTQGKV